MSKSPIPVVRPFGEPPASLWEEAQRKGWMDEQIAIIGTTRRKVALARGVVPATLQNYATRPNSKVPEDLVLWLWEEVQWRQRHPVPPAAADD